jgi:trehalose 6-phosphate synthase/phosphatase
MHCFTCTVGKKPSAAANYVNDVDDVHELLESLVKVSARTSVHTGFHSVVNLKSMEGNPASSSPALKTVLSLGQIHSAKHSPEPLLQVNQSKTQSVSMNLTEFLGMGPIESATDEDDDEEDIFF